MSKSNTRVDCAEHDATAHRNVIARKRKARHKRIRNILFFNFFVFGLASLTELPRLSRSPAPAIRRVRSAPEPPGRPSSESCRGRASHPPAPSPSALLVGALHNKPHTRAATLLRTPPSPPPKPEPGSRRLETCTPRLRPQSPARRSTAFDSPDDRPRNVARAVRAVPSQTAGAWTLQNFRLSISPAITVRQPGCCAQSTANRPRARRQPLS